VIGFIESLTPLCRSDAARFVGAGDAVVEAATRPLPPRRLVADIRIVDVSRW
jgi:hypothetical protein